MARRGGLIALLVAAFVLHQDFWLWHDASRVAGLPVGLAYHVGYCLVVAGLLGVLVRLAWPVGLFSH